MSDTLEMWGKEWTGVTGFKANNDSHTQLTFVRPQGSINITSNGSNIDVAHYATANVSVSGSAPSLQSKSKTYTPTTSKQEETISADNGYDGLSSVAITVNAMPSGSATTPATSITANPSISVSSSGLITATASATKSVTPTVSAGYVSSGTAGTITVSGSNTSQLTTLGATTYNTSSSDQTITSGKYITGTQTIKAVTTSGLTAANIKSGTTVKVGDANDDDRIASVSGTFTAANTISSGQTAAGASQLLSGYSAFIDGSEIKGNIATKTSSDLTASAQTVTVPAGYYASQATKSVSTLTLPTSASSSATSGYASKATIDRSTSDQYINIGTGYNTAGGYYKISAVANGSATAPSTISGTSASVSTGTNTLTLSKTVSVTPSVTAGYISSGTAGNANVSLTASVTTLGATTYNTSSSNQTIASGTYLTGAQTIRAVTTSNISAANIKAGVTINVGDSADADRIAGVTGTFTSDATAAAGDIVSGKSAYVNGSKVDGSLTFQTIYTGTSNPSSGTGSNGDIYIKTTS